jgi:FMN reductase
MGRGTTRALYWICVAMSRFSSSTSSAKVKPLIVGLGGTVKQGSSTEQALQIALAEARVAGADTVMFGGEQLCGLPHYGVPGASTSQIAVQLIAELRRADGLIVASPGYHGGVSGLVKNALDYTEDMVSDPRVYLDGLPVGLIVTAYGWQATGSTLAALRAIVHALRGWPTPLGAAINCSGGIFANGECTVEAFAQQLREVGRQVAIAAAPVCLAETV